jgi:tetratricopeptide (TPR) repeat protein
MASSARIDELQKKFDENPKRYFAPLANEFRKAGDLEQAIALCRAFLPQQPGHMSGHIVFGQALFESKLHDEARTVFETALALDPENLIALRHLGDIARETGDIGAAAGWYRRVLDADPRNDEIAELLATLPVLSPAADAAPSPDAAAQWSEPAPADASASSAAPAMAAPEPASAPAPRPSGGVREQADAGPLSMRESLEMPAVASPAPSDGIERSTEVDIGTLAAEPAASPSPAFTSSGPANDMGFEVMEFVPPDRAESASRPSGFVEDAPGADAGTPAAFVTETMAELYLQQGFYQEALTVYRQLLAQNPGDVGLRERVEQLASGARSSVGVAAVSDAVIESAQRRRAGPAVRTIRAFLASLAGRRVVLRADADAPEEGEEQGERQRWSAPVVDLPVAVAPERDERGDAYEPQAASYVDGADDEPSGADLPWLTTDEEAAEPSAPSMERTEHRAADGPRGDGGERSEASESSSPGAGPDDAHAEETRPARLSGEMGSVNTLFSGAPVTGDDAAAAELLAGAFLVPEGAPPAAPSTIGRPARAAANELSLDNVFREPGQRTSTEQRRSAFSFDQFFSEGGSGDAGGAADAEEEHSPDDIAQFNAWLEGLKKK